MIKANDQDDPCSNTLPIRLWFDQQNGVTHILAASPRCWGVHPIVNFYPKLTVTTVPSHDEGAVFYWLLLSLLVYEPFCKGLRDS